MQKNRLIPLLLVIFLIGIVSAAQTAVYSQTGLIINSVDPTTVKETTNFTFIWDLGNKSNGVAIRNNESHCIFHLFNLDNGASLISAIALETLDGYGFYYMVNQNNFTSLGHYASEVYCETDDGSLGDTKITPFKVTSTGEDDYGNWSIGVLIVLILISSLLIGCSYLFNAEQVWFKFLFISIGIGILVLASNGAGIVADDTILSVVISRVTITLIILMMFIIAYILIYATKEILNKIKNSKKERLRVKYGSPLN